MIEWECLKGLGIDRKREDRKNKAENKKPHLQKKFTPQEKKQNRIKRATKRILKGKWIGRGSFLLAHDNYLKSPKWQAFRKRILLRCDGFCENCFSKPNFLHVHHLTYERWGQEFEEDVLALCKDCHNGMHQHMNHRNTKNKA